VEPYANLNPKKETVVLESDKNYFIFVLIWHPNLTSKVYL